MLNTPVVYFAEYNTGGVFNTYTTGGVFQVLNTPPLVRCTDPVRTKH